MRSITQVLLERGYPGRGCLAARTHDGTLYFAYFLTGRSLASRARTLIVLDDGDLRVADTSQGPHDELRHYVAVARRGSWCVVGNGDQVVPIAETLAKGVAELQAWDGHTFEPDPPIFTSRIWLAHSSVSNADCVLGYARRSGRGDDGTDRALLAIETFTPGTGVLMTTYDGSATGVHVTRSTIDVAVQSISGEGLLAEIWAALDPQLRVAAVVLRPDERAAAPLLTSA